MHGRSKPAFVFSPTSRLCLRAFVSRTISPPWNSSKKTTKPGDTNFSKCTQNYMTTILMTSQWKRRLEFRRYFYVFRRLIWEIWGTLPCIWNPISPSRPKKGSFGMFSILGRLIDVPQWALGGWGRHGWGHGSVGSVPDRPIPLLFIKTWPPPNTQWIPSGHGMRPNAFMFWLNPSWVKCWILPFKCAFIA